MFRKIMSTWKGAHYIKLIILLIIALGLGASYYSTYYVIFQIRNHDTDEILFQKKLLQNSEITLQYIHSVTKQPVYEIFTVWDKNTLALKEMRYDSFGANLPVGSEQLSNETTTFIVADNYYKILYENRKFARVPLRVGKVIANHMLVFEDGTQLPILDVATGGEYVEFYVRPITEIFFGKREQKVLGRLELFEHTE